MFNRWTLFISSLVALFYLSSCMTYSKGSHLLTDVKASPSEVSGKCGDDPFQNTLEIREGDLKYELRANSFTEKSLFGPFLIPFINMEDEEKALVFSVRTSSALNEKAKMARAKLHIGQMEMMPSSIEETDNSKYDQAEYKFLYQIIFKVESLEKVETVELILPKFRSEDVRAIKFKMTPYTSIRPILPPSQSCESRDGR